MRTFSDVINRWPSITEFARDIRVEYGTAQVMRYRNSVAPRHWPMIVAAAQRRGFNGVTLELLTSFKTKTTAGKPNSKRRTEARVA